MVWKCADIASFGNWYFPQKVSDECFSSTDEQEVTEERIEINSNSGLTRDNGSNFPEISENDLKEALNETQSKNSCGIDIITNNFGKRLTRFSWRIKFCSENNFV